MSENRISRRLSLKAAIALRIAGQKPIHGWIRDISITGVHIKTDERVMPGTLCQLCLVVRDGNERRRIHLEAKVVRQDAQGMGLQFLPMEPDVQADMSNLLLRNMTVSAPK